jgi:hypothetical protein
MLVQGQWQQRLGWMQVQRLGQMQVQQLGQMQVQQLGQMQVQVLLEATTVESGLGAAEIRKHCRGLGSPFLCRLTAVDDAEGKVPSTLSSERSCRRRLGV